MSFFDYIPAVYAYHKLTGGGNKDQLTQDKYNQQLSKFAKGGNSVKADIDRPPQHYLNPAQRADQFAQEQALSENAGKNFDRAAAARAHGYTSSPAYQFLASNYEQGRSAGVAANKTREDVADLMRGDQLNRWRASELIRLRQQKLQALMGQRPVAQNGINWGELIGKLGGAAIGAAAGGPAGAGVGSSIGGSIGGAAGGNYTKTSTGGPGSYDTGAAVSQSNMMDQGGVDASADEAGYY